MIGSKRYRRDSYVPGYRPLDSRILLTRLLHLIVLQQADAYNEVLNRLNDICSPSFGPAGRPLQRVYNRLLRDCPRSRHLAWWRNELQQP